MSDKSDPPASSDYHETDSINVPSSQPLPVQEPESEWETKVNAATGEDVVVNKHTGEAAVQIEADDGSLLGGILSAAAATEPGNQDVSPLKEDVLDVEAVGTSPFVAPSGKVLQYQSDSEAEDDEASFNPEDVDRSNMGVQRLMAFTENSLGMMSKERERLASEAKEFEAENDNNGEEGDGNALVISASNSVGSSSPLKDDKLSSSDLENPWAEVDDGSGNSYYHNIATGESTWVKPEGLKDSSSQQGANWVEQKDDQGNTYYLDTKTGETSWSKPSRNGNSPAPSVSSHTTGGSRVVVAVEEEEEEEELELLDGNEADEWPVVDELVGTVGGDYAKRIGMTTDDYAQLTGVKLDFEKVDDLGLFAATSSGMEEVTLDVVYAELDKIMSGSFHEINKTFREIDDNGDGTLQPEEFRKALSTHGMKLNDNKFDILWKEFDVDGDGSITYKEFVRRYVDRKDKEVPNFHAWSIYPWKMVDAGTFIYYQNTITGRTQREMPKPAFEKKIEALSMLTPRDEDNPDDFMWREGPEEERRRRRFERQEKRKKEEEERRRREEPTEFEQVEDVVEDLVHTVEYELTEERLIAEHEAEVLKRSVWHPATISFFMKDLPQGGQGNRDLHIDARKLVTDADFIESKVTMGGEVVNWHPLAKKPYKTKGQSLWAKMANAEGATKAFGNIARRISRKTGDGKGRSLSSLGKAALDEIKKEEEEKKKKLEEAIVGLTTADDENADEETGVKPQPTAFKLVSALKSSITMKLPGIGESKDGENDEVKGNSTEEKKKKKKKKKFLKMPKMPWSGKKKETEKRPEVKIETPEESRKRERAERRSRRSRGSRGSKDSVDSLEGVGVSGKEKEGEEEDTKKKDTDDEAEEKKKKEKLGIISKFKNPFKKVKTPEEIEEEERKAKALVYGEDHTDANEIVRRAKEEKARQNRPWEHPREAPVEVARVHFSIASHAPKHISERTVTEKAEDGTKTTRVVIDAEKRKKWENKLIKELASIAGVKKEHVTIDEITNRNTTEGYFQGHTWCIGTEGEFKSVQQKYIEVEEKKQEERERARSSSFANKMKEKAEKMNFPSLVVSPKNIPTLVVSPKNVMGKKGEKEEGAAGEESSDLPEPTQLKLPDIAKKTDTPDGKKGAQAAPHSKKRDFIAAMGRQASQGVGNRWGTSDLANSDAKKKRKASTAEDVMKQQLEDLMKKTEKNAAKRNRVAVHADYEKHKLEDEKNASAEKNNLMAKCLPGLNSDEDGSALLSALKFKGSDTARCNIVVTFTSSPYVKAVAAAVRVTKATTEGLGLPPNGLMSTCVRCRPDLFGERKFFEEWEHYWVNFITPVFFGYSTRKRFKTKTKHKFILDAPKLEIVETKRMILEKAYDRACAEYKRRFARGEVSEEYWTPEQLQAHAARERAEFKLDLHLKHLKRQERKEALERSPEPWMRPKAKPKPFTKEQVEKWERKFDKKQARARKKQREKNKKIHEKNKKDMLIRVWNRKVQQWLRDKLLSFNANKTEVAQRMSRITTEEEEAHLKFVQEETDGDKIDAANKELSRKQEKRKEEEKEVVAIFCELSGIERVVKKRDILYKLGESKKLKNRAKKLASMKPLVTSPEFINAFMVSPAMVSGHVDLHEFKTFCQGVYSIGNLYIKAKILLKEEKEAEEKKEEEKVNRREELKKLRAQQAAKRAKDVAAKQAFEAGKIKGVYFRADQKRVRDESGEVWKKFHHRCIIRLPGSSASYDCESRRRKWEYDMKNVMEMESNWRSEWADFHDVLKETRKKMFTAMVERRIEKGARRLTKMQKQTVKLALSDMVATVERRAWVENEVASVLYGVAEKVSLKEGRRLQNLGEVFGWHEEDEDGTGGGGEKQKKKKKKLSKQRIEEMYKELHDGVERDEFDTFLNCVGHMEKLTARSLAEFLYKYREASDTELQNATFELEMNEDLPDGWRMVQDEQKQVWYENDITGVSQWERPTRKGKPVRDYITSVLSDYFKGERDEEEEEEELTLTLTLDKLSKVSIRGANLDEFYQSTTKEQEREKKLRTLSMASSSGSLIQQQGSGSGGVGSKPRPSLKEFGKHKTIKEQLFEARELVRKEADNAMAENDSGSKNDQNAGCGQLVGDTVGSKLSIEIFDMDTLGKGDFLGQVVVPFEKLCNPPGDGNTFEVDLTRAAEGSVNNSLSVEKVKGVLGLSLQALKLNEETDKIEEWTLRIMHAKGIAKADMFGKSDPICFVKWGEQDIGKTRCIKNTLDPVWDGGEEETFRVPTEEAREKDEAATTLLKRTMQKTKALGDALSSRKKLFGSMLKKGILNVKMFAGVAKDARMKIGDEVETRLKFWDEETTREEMERRYMAREEIRQKKLEEVRLRARERNARDEQESGHRSYLDIVNKCRSLRSGLLRYKWHRTLMMNSQHDMLSQVQDPSSGKYYVVKMLPCEYDEDCERTIAEAELIEDISHPGVVRVKSVQRHLIQKFTDLGSATERWHLAIFVNEWCGGGKLIDYLRTIDHLKVPGRQMQMWCQQACAGLKAAHELGICHRNLNPGNIYLDNSGKAKIGGFAAFKFPRGPGCAFSYGRCDVGTPAIIAPEVDDGYEVTTKADMWALGCCFYYFCTGTLPDLRTMGVENALRKVSLHFGERIRGAIRMCLQVHPDVRSDAEEVWMYLSVVDAMQKKKKRALKRLKGMIGAKQLQGGGGGLTSVVAAAQQSKLKLRLLADKAKGGEGDGDGRV